MDCSPRGSSFRGILQTRIVAWVVLPFSRGSSQPRIKPGSPASQADSLPSEPPGKPFTVQGDRHAELQDDVAGAALEGVCGVPVLSWGPLSGQEAQAIGGPSRVLPSSQESQLGAV